MHQTLKMRMYHSIRVWKTWHIVQETLYNRDSKDKWRESTGVDRGAVWRVGD